jgi:outer membrane protein TolC
MFRYTLSLLFTFLLLSQLYAQNSANSLTLEDAYAILEQTNPQLQDKKIIEQLSDKEQQITDKAKLPQLMFKGQAQTQSASVQLELPPGVSLPFTINQPRNTYKTYAEAQYTIYDGGFNKAQKEITSAKLQSDLINLAVTEYQLQGQINELFLKINLLKEQKVLLEYTLNALSERKETVSAGVAEGVLLQSELTRITIKILELTSQQNNLKENINGLVAMLSTFLNKEITAETNLILPKKAAQNTTTTRPELQLIAANEKQLLAGIKTIDAARKPKIGAYAQGGVGYPNPLNFLNNETSTYGLAGVQFNWQITDWKKSSTQKEMIALQSEKLKNADAALQQNISAKHSKYVADVKRLNAQLESDKQIVKLQEQITEQTKAMLDDGVINHAEYINQLNEELKAKQNIVIHNAELQSIEIGYWYDLGANFSTTKTN